MATFSKRYKTRNYRRNFRAHSFGGFRLGVGYTRIRHPFFLGSKRGLFRRAKLPFFSVKSSQLHTRNVFSEFKTRYGSRSSKVFAYPATVFTGKRALECIKTERKLYSSGKTVHPNGFSFRRFFALFNGSLTMCPSPARTRKYVRSLSSLTFGS